MDVVNIWYARGFTVGWETSEDSRRYDGWNPTKKSDLAFEIELTAEGQNAQSNLTFGQRTLNSQTHKAHTDKKTRLSFYATLEGTERNEQANKGEDRRKGRGRG